MRRRQDEKHSISAEAGKQCSYAPQVNAGRSASEITHSGAQTAASEAGQWKMIEPEKNSVLDALIGCRIKTHYGTGGIVTLYSGPYDDDEWPWGKGRYTIQYRHKNEKKPSCWINSIKVENGVITCEGIPLQILGREENSQMSLF